MAKKGANMKVNMTAENSDLVQKSKESKKALQDFTKVGENALSKLGDAFGVNTGKIEQMASAVRGLGTKMQDSGNIGTAAFGRLLAGVGGLTTALAGIGIGAAVTSFKLLNNEAQAFQNTVRGANLELQTNAYIATYAQALHDANESIGEGTATTIAEITKKWKTFWADASFVAVNTISEIGKGGLGTEGGGDRALAKLREVKSAALDAASQAEGISSQIYEVTRQISDKTVEWARMEREIAEYKRIAYDKTSSTVQQQEALTRSVELIKTRYGEQAELQGRLADLQEEYNSLAESSVADIDKANQLRVQAENITASMNNALRELSERQATVAQNAQKEAAARAQSLAAVLAMVQSKTELMNWNGAISSSNQLASQASSAGAIQLSAPTIAMPSADLAEQWAKEWGDHLTVAINGLHIDANPYEGLIDVTQETVSIISSSFESLGTFIGGLVGDLATGGDAWGNFANAAISAFGDMAISVGKMAISTGVATLGIKAALESLNGYAAIAAGIALVALGTAVKTGLSNIASGGYSSSANVATSGNYGTSSSNSSFETREVQIKVTGKLYASGNQLIAAIESENNRKNHTT